MAVSASSSITLKQGIQYPGNRSFAQTEAYYSIWSWKIYYKLANKYNCTLFTKGRKKTHKITIHCKRGEKRMATTLKL